MQIAHFKDRNMILLQLINIYRRESYFIMVIRFTGADLLYSVSIKTIVIFETLIA